jgi:hypothetical protein
MQQTRRQILAEARAEFSRRGGMVTGEAKRRGGPEYYREMARRSAVVRRAKRDAKGDK